MKMLRKIIDRKSLEISQKNVYDGVSFSKVTNLQCSDCNFAIKITQNRYFLEYLPNTGCLKKQRQWRHPDVFIFNFEHISHFSLVFLLLLWTGKFLLGLFKLGLHQSGGKWWYHFSNY